MVKFLINRPVSVLMTFLALLILAGQSGRLLPVSLLPDIGIPEISIHLNLPNASAKELEHTAVQKVREQLLQVNGLRNIESETRHENALIRLQLDYGVDIDYAFMEVNEKIDRSMEQLPREMDRPQVIKASASDIPVFHLKLTLKDSSAFQGQTLRWLEFSNFARQVIRRRLEQLPELALVDISGYAEPEIYIRPDEEKMKSLDIDHKTIQQAIESNNIQLGNIIVQDRQYQYNVQLNFQLTSIEDIQNLYFKKGEQLFQLKDIARIGMREQQPKGLYLSNGQPAISLAIIKQANARMADLDAAVQNLIHHFEWEYPDIDFQISQDQAALLKGSIQNLEQSLLMGCLFVVLILFIFMRSWKTSLIVGISIPIALLISLIFFYGLGISINIISLSGLIMGVGLMIDNAVIVVDNISQASQRGATLEQACTVGTNQVIRPLIASALTTCLIFLPLIFLSGISGLLFFDQAVAVAVGLGVSLLVSITLIPTLYFAFFQKTDQAKASVKKEIAHPLLARMYSKGIQAVFRYPALSLLTALLITGGGIWCGTQLQQTLLPSIDKNEMLVNIDWSENLSIRENHQRINELYRQFKPALSDFSSLIGESQYLFLKQSPASADEAQLYLQSDNANSLRQVEKGITQYLRQYYPSAILQFRSSETIFDRLFPKEPMLSAAIASRGMTEAEQIDLLRHLHKNISAESHTMDIQLPATEEVIQLRISPAQLLLYEVPLQRLHSELKKALSSKRISLLRSYRDRIPVVLNSRPKLLSDLLNELHVKNEKGIAIPVRTLLKAQRQEQFKSIRANKAGPFIALNLDSPAPAQSLQTIQQFAAAHPAINIQLTGQHFENHSLLQELLQVLLIAIVLLYFVLAAQFESLLQPFIILLEIPISLAGALAFLFLFGSSLNLLSMIGMIVLTGIIINDSILKVDTINHLRREGMPLKKAIHEGGLRRLHPIIMTSLTTILALLPFLFMADMSAQLQRPLALALIGGTLMGALVSLYFIPLVYYEMYKKRQV